LSRATVAVAVVVVAVAAVAVAVATVTVGVATSDPVRRGVVESVARCVRKNVALLHLFT
jgi:hypothetical protein